MRSKRVAGKFRIRLKSVSHAPTDRMSGGEMKTREKHSSQWREILSAGVDGWSSFSDTCSDEPNENAKEGTTTTATNSVARSGMKQCHGI